MEIVRERFLDDSKLYHVTLAVRSRTTEMHSVLSALTSDERDAVGAALAKALDEIGMLVKPRLEVERDRLSHPQPITG
jgi:hypothetical protein